MKGSDYLPGWQVERIGGIPYQSNTGMTSTTLAEIEKKLENLHAERNYCIAAIYNKQAQLNELDAKIEALNNYMDASQRYDESCKALSIACDADDHEAVIRLTAQVERDLLDVNDARLRCEMGLPA